MSRWQEFTVALLATGGIVKIIEVIYKLFEYLTQRFKQKTAEDTSLILHDKDELSAIRAYFAEKAERAEAAYDKVKEEHHQLERKLDLMERDLKDKDREILKERQYSGEQADELLIARAECDALKRENDHLKRLSIVGGVQEE